MKLIHSLKKYIRNITLFRKLLRYYSPYDYTGMLLAMKICLDDMQDKQGKEKDWVKVNQEKCCKKMKVVSNSLGRLIEQEYTIRYFDYDYSPFKGITVTKLKDMPTQGLISKVDKSCLEVDLEIVSKAIRNNLIHWWS